MSPDVPTPGSPEDWLRHARSDLALARQRNTPDILLTTLCFHTQQAAEKALKAVLLQNGVVFPYTHDLARLITLVQEARIGLGWLMGKHGLSCDNLLSADMVTADGQFLTASAREHPDLFWGLRGGGGNLGVVTSFEYQLHPVDSVLAGMVLHPMAKAKDVLRFYRDYARNAPDELTAFAALMTSPEGAPVVAIIVGYIGPMAEGERLVAPVRKFGAPLADTIGPMSYVQLNTMFDAAFPYGGVQRYWKSSFLKHLGDDVLDILVTRAATMPSPLSMVGFFHVHGAASRVKPNETAFGLRDDQWDYDIISQWLNPAETAQHIQWTRAFWTAVEPFATGEVYVNHLDAEEGTRIKAAYSDNYERLVALKNKYDPANLFRLNQNIKPTV